LQPLWAKPDSSTTNFYFSSFTCGLPGANQVLIHSTVKTKILSALKYLVGLGIGVGLLILTFRNINLDEAMVSLKQADFLFVAAAMGVSLFSHFLRAVRWKMLLKPAGYATDTLNTFASVMVGYMANNAVPRLGEVSRCSMLLKSDQVPFPVSLGTVVLERVIDVVVMAGFIGLAFLLEYDRLMQIVAETLGAQSGGPSATRYLLLVVLGLGSVMAVWAMRKYYNQIKAHPVAGKVLGFAEGLWTSVLGIFKLRNPGSFIAITLLIWLCYIAQYFVCFYALPDTSGLSFYFAMMIMILGGIGIVLPVPGGVGAFHFFCQLTFIVFGYSEQTGAGYALLIHTSQYLMLIAVGALAYFYLVIRPVRNAEIPKT
jgi:uncharacterized membrane protein YbhN (UPF0104 family)